MAAGTIYIMLPAMLLVSSYTWLMICVNLKRLLFFFCNSIFIMAAFQEAMFDVPLCLP